MRRIKKQSGGLFFRRLASPSVCRTCFRSCGAFGRGRDYGVSGLSCLILRGCRPRSCDLPGHRAASQHHSPCRPAHSADRRLHGRASGPVQSLTWPAVMKTGIGHPSASVTACSLAFMPQFVRPIRWPIWLSGALFSTAGSRPCTAPSNTSRRS